MSSGLAQRACDGLLAVINVKTTKVANLERARIGFILARERQGLEDFLL